MSLKLPLLAGAMMTTLRLRMRTLLRLVRRGGRRLQHRPPSAAHVPVIAAGWRGPTADCAGTEAAAAHHIEPSGKHSAPGDAVIEKTMLSYVAVFTDLACEAATRQFQ